MNTELHVAMSSSGSEATNKETAAPKQPKTPKRGDSSSESESDSEQQNGDIRCICGDNSDHGLMIQCEKCLVWQHSICVGIRGDKSVPKHYYCEICAPRTFKCLCNKGECSGKVIQCSQCSTWQHIRCLGKSTRALPKPYKCPTCDPSVMENSIHNGKMKKKRKGSSEFDFITSKRLRDEMEEDYFIVFTRNLTKPKTSKDFRTLYLTNRGILEKYFVKLMDDSSDEKFVLQDIARGVSVILECDQDTILKSFEELVKFIDQTSSSSTEKQQLTDYTKGWSQIKDNVYTSKVKKPPLQKPETPTCNPSEGPKLCSGDTCFCKLNHLECGSNCPCGCSKDEGDACQNKQIHNGNSAPVSIQKVAGNTKWGMFSTSTIQPNQLVTEFLGSVVETEQLEYRNLSMEERTFILALLSMEVCVDARKYGNNARFVRRSCKPNAEVRELFVSHQLRVGIFAREEIPPDTEITIGFDYPWRESVSRFHCACGSADCVVTAWHDHLKASTKKVLSEIQSTDANHGEDTLEQITKKRKLEQAISEDGDADLDKLSREERKIALLMKSIQKMESRQNRKRKKKPGRDDSSDTSGVSTPQQMDVEPEPHTPNGTHLPSATPSSSHSTLESSDGALTQPIDTVPDTKSEPSTASPPAPATSNAPVPSNPTTSTSEPATKPVVSAPVKTESAPKEPKPVASAPAVPKVKKPENSEKKIVTSSPSPSLSTVSVSDPAKRKGPGRPPKIPKTGASPPMTSTTVSKEVPSKRPGRPPMVKKKEETSVKKEDKPEKPEKSEKSEKSERAEPKFTVKKVTTTTSNSPSLKDKVAVPIKPKEKEVSTPKISSPIPKPVVNSPKLVAVKASASSSPPKLKTSVKVGQGSSTPEIQKVKVQFAPSTPPHVSSAVTTASPMSTMSTPSTADDYKSPRMMNPKFGKKAWIQDYQNQETKTPSSQKSEQAPAEPAVKLPLKKKWAQMMEIEKTETNPVSTSSPPSQVVEVSTPPASVTSISEAPKETTTTTTPNSDQVESTLTSSLSTETLSNQGNLSIENSNSNEKPSVSMETASPPMSLSPVASIQSTLSSESETTSTTTETPIGTTSIETPKEEVKPEEESKPMNGTRTVDDSMDIDEDDMAPTNILYVSGTPSTPSTSSTSTPPSSLTPPASMLYNNGVGTIPGIHPWSYGTGPLQFPFPAPTYKAPTYPMPYPGTVPQSTLDGLQQNTGQQFSQQYPHRAT